MNSKYIFVGVTLFVVLSLFGMAAMIQRDQTLESNPEQSPLQKIMHGGESK